MKTITVGVIGVGRIGKIHLENLCYRFPEVTVKAVADIQKEGRDYAGKFPVEKITDNYHDLVNDPSIEALVICSPTDTHAGSVMEAARVGKAIFCEKPLDLSLSKVKEVLRVAEECGAPLMIGFNRRFDANFQKVQEMVAQGNIGDPHIVKITSRDPGPPPISYIKVSGGMFLDMTIHDFDMARFLVGSEVKEVFAKAGVLVDKAIGEAGDVDTAIITLYFENGVIGVIDNSRKATYGYDQRVEVFGSKGMVNADNNFPDTHRFYHSEGITGPLPYNFFMDRYTQAYLNEMRAFVQAIAEKQPLPVTGKDGLMSMAIALAAKRSVAENRPVTVQEILGEG